MAITAWLWDFGDGSFSTEQNPVHRYASPGTYTVSLTVSNDDGSDTETKTNYLTVEPTSVWDVFDPGDPEGAKIGTLSSATKRSVRIELNGAGAGQFRINRHAADATAAMLARGNVVKCRWPELSDEYIFAFLIEEGDFDLLSPDEEGGEDLTFGGRGILAYLDRARMWNQAFTTGLDINDTWTQIWESAGVLRPSGTWFDASEGRVNVIDQVTRCRYQIDQTTRAATIVSAPLFAGPAGGLSGDPSDPTVYWTLEAPWLTGGSGHTKIHKHDKDTDAILDTFDMGSAIAFSSIKVSASYIYATRYGNATNAYQLSKVDGSVAASGTVSFNGSALTTMSGVSVNGTDLAWWADGTGVALLADESAFTTVMGSITTTDIASLGGDWFTDGGNDYFIMDSAILGRTWKYQVTAATPHDPLDGIWRLDEATPGAILNRLIAEAQDPSRPRQPIQDLSKTFDYDLDSNGNAWNAHDGTLEFDAQVGESLLAVVLRLVAYGLELQMTPGLELIAVNAFGTVRSGDAFATDVVRFQAGVNLAEGLQRKMASRELDSYLLAGGDGGLYATAELDDLGYVQEGFLETKLIDATALAGTAEAILAQQRRRNEELTLATIWGNDPANGRYLPWVHYWVGDTVRVNTGSGDFDFDEEDFRVYGLTLVELDNGQWDALPDLAEGITPLPTAGGTGTAGVGGGGAAGGGGPTSVTVRGLDDTGAVVTSAMGTRIESADLQVVQKEPGVIGVAVTSRSHAIDGPEHTDAGDSTRLDATTDAHGLLPKLSGDADDALRGDGTWGPVAGAFGNIDGGGPTSVYGGVTTSPLDCGGP